MAQFQATYQKGCVPIQIKIIQVAIPQYDKQEKSKKKSIKKTKAQSAQEKTKNKWLRNKRKHTKKCLEKFNRPSCWAAIREYKTVNNFHPWRKQQPQKIHE